MENQMSMHVIYMGEEDEVMFRDVIFPKNESVDLTDNPKLFEKLSKLPYFMVVSLLTDEDVDAMELEPGQAQLPNGHIVRLATEEEIARNKKRLAEQEAQENEPVDPPVAPVEAPRRGRGRPRKVV